MEWTGCFPRTAGTPVGPGLHEAIIDEELWNEVQAALAENRVEHVTWLRAGAPSLLAGLV